MSLHKVATVKPAAGKVDRPAKNPGKRDARPTVITTTSEEAIQFASQLERDLKHGRIDQLAPTALQALMSAACKAYAARIEAGEDLLPFGPRSGVSPTDVMVTASGLLRSVNLAVFELGMWQSWTGR
jgi:hypothetical protein